jgi:hypothetical protein
MSEHFVSEWAGELGGFLAFKRSLGYGYHRAGFTLRALDHFLVAQGATRSHRQLDASVLRWLVGRPGRKLISMADELCVVREFYRFLRRSGRRIAPDPPWPRVSWSSDFVPYIPGLLT